MTIEDWTDPKQECDHVIGIDDTAQPYCDTGAHLDDDILRSWRASLNGHYMPDETRESQRVKWKGIVAQAMYGILKTDPEYHKPRLTAADIVEPLRRDFILHLDSRMFPHLEPPAWLNTDEQLVIEANEAEAVWLLFCQRDRNAILLRNGSLGGALEQLPAAPEPRKRGVIAATVKPQATEWLWPNRYELGKIGDIQGDPGTGKSAITASIAAVITKLGAWPTGEPCELGGAIMINGEEDLKDGIVPHLIAADADLRRIKIYTLLDEPLFELPRDLGLLEQDVVEVKARVIIIDPLDCFVNEDVEMNRNQTIRRQVLAALARLAAQHKLTVLIVRHLNKDAKSRVAMYRGGGSIGLNAASRAVWLVGPSPMDKTLKVMAMVKVNNAPPQRSLSYRLEEAFIKGAEGEDIKTMRVTWGDEVDIEAHQLLATPEETAKRNSSMSKLPEVAKILTELLSDGREHRAKDIETKIKGQLGVSHGTIFNAKEALGVVARKDGLGAWLWRLPDDSSEESF